MVHIKKTKEVFKKTWSEIFFGILLPTVIFQMCLLPLWVTPYPQFEHGTECPLPWRKFEATEKTIEPQFGFWNSKSYILRLRSWTVYLVFIVNNSMLSSPWVRKRVSRLGGRGKMQIWKEKERSRLKGVCRMKKLNRYKGLDQPPPEVASTSQVRSEQHKIVHLYFTERWGPHGLVFLAKSGSDLLSTTASIPCVEHLSMGPWDLLGHRMTFSSEQPLRPLSQAMEGNGGGGWGSERHWDGWSSRGPESYPQAVPGWGLTGSLQVDHWAMVVMKDSPGPWVSRFI